MWQLMSFNFNDITCYVNYHVNHHMRFGANFGTQFDVYSITLYYIFNNTRDTNLT